MNGSVATIIGTVAGAIVSFLAWQVFVNSNRISVIEENLRNHVVEDAAIAGQSKGVEIRVEDLERRLDVLKK